MTESIRLQHSLLFPLTPSLTVVRTTILSTLFLFAVVFLTGCSAIRSRGEVTPEMKVTVVKVANDYISLIANGNFARASEKVLWVDYLITKGGKTSKEEIRQQVEALKAIPYERHPLKDLAILDLKVEPDRAEIALKRENDPASRAFVIRLGWGGRAWLVTGDTLLGPDGALASHPTVLELNAANNAQPPVKTPVAKGPTPVITAPRHPAPHSATAIQDPERLGETQ